MPRGVVDDLSTLEILDERTILDELQARYKNGIYYTYIGDVLVAINPFHSLHLYGREYHEKYRNVKVRSQLSPHVFWVADQSYQRMRETHNSQCILVSGESGAGKTESVKLIIRHITQLSPSANAVLSEKIIMVNPLLEAFGNARTVMNNNSSRFGKYVELNCTKDGTLIGGTIRDYLLEKSRVVRQGPGERNFHVFYNLFAGMSENRLRYYYLEAPEKYRIINQTTHLSGQVFSTEKEKLRCQHMFQKQEDIMRLIGFTEKDVSTVYTLLSSILHLSNIDFANNEVTDGVYITDEYPLKVVANLLSLDKTELTTALISTSTSTKGEEVVHFKNKDQAKDGQDALAKAVYQRLFGWLVRQINIQLKPKVDLRPGLITSIGILDMSGFENFKTNRFEQLCINVANEQLQYFFNEHIFSQEQRAYEGDGIDWTRLKYENNGPLLDLFLSKPVGIFAYLDEDSKFPKATDGTFVQKLNTNFADNQYFSKSPGDQVNFTIKHFAGMVTYDCNGILESNRDTLSMNLRECLAKSSNDLISKLFTAKLSDTGTISRSETNFPIRAKNPFDHTEIGHQNVDSISKTTGAKLLEKIRRSREKLDEPGYSRPDQTLTNAMRNSLFELMEKMSTCQPLFVRCMKPNRQLQADKFQSDVVLDQLRSNGLLGIAKIRRIGYPIRMEFADFIEKYKVVAFQASQFVKPLPVNCIEILKRVHLTDYAIGETKVFLKFWHQDALHSYLSRITTGIVDLQAQVRGYLTRQKYTNSIREAKSRARRRLVNRTPSLTSGGRASDTTHRTSTSRKTGRTGTETETLTERTSTKIDHTTDASHSEITDLTHRHQISTGKMIKEKEEDENLLPEHLWNVFQLIPRERVSASESFANAVKVIKLVFYITLFGVVLGGTVLSKSTLLLLTSGLGSRLGQKAKAAVVQRNSCASMLILCIIVPHILTFLMYLAKALFGSQPWPTGKMALKILTVELLQTLGMCLLIFRVLPEVDMIRGLFILNACCVVPVFCKLFFSHKPVNEKRRTIWLIVNFFALTVQLSAIGVILASGFKLSKDSLLDMNEAKKPITTTPAPQSEFEREMSILEGGRIARGVDFQLEKGMRLQRSIEDTVLGDKLMNNLAERIEKSREKRQFDFSFGGLTPANGSSGGSRGRGRPKFGMKPIMYMRKEVDTNDFLRGTILWEAAIASVLVSLAWWENFVDKNLYFGKRLILPMRQFKAQLHECRQKATVFVSLWKTGLTIAFAYIFVPDFSFSFFVATVTGNHNTDTLIDYAPLFVQMFTSMAVYYFGSLACKLCMQHFSFSVPLALSTPVTFVVLWLQCHTTPVLPENPYTWVCSEMSGVIFSWHMIAAALWWISQLIIAGHIWFPQAGRLEATERLFVLPVYCGTLIEQWMMFNRRRDDKEVIWSSTSGEIKYIDVDDRMSQSSMTALTGTSRTSTSRTITNHTTTNNRSTTTGFSKGKSEDDTEQQEEEAVPVIYACATMWHETREEMMKLLKSIFRMDVDQCARRNAREFFGIKDPDYYEYETHILFDDAMDLTDDHESVPNMFVQRLFEVIDEAGSSVHESAIKLPPPTKVPTPYGGRLVWILPGGSTLHVHIKDKHKIRHRKRWSQCMYMYYLLGYRLMAQREDEFMEENKTETASKKDSTGTAGSEISSMRKRTKSARNQNLDHFTRSDIFKRVDERLHRQAETTFILTLDGDIDFKPDAVRLLIDRMKKNKKVGAACGRIHPIGSGPMVWYQQFEYAIGHWLQKAAEHVLGCVLCSPGCFSLFRGSALMDDNVMRAYIRKATEAAHYVQYDQGEDRWLCTLMLQQGYRIEYCAASDALTQCPEAFSEFYNQRRRWGPSTLANIVDLLQSYENTVRINDNISYFYMLYQFMLFVSTILGPATVVMMIAGSFNAVLGTNLWQSYLMSLGPAIFFTVICMSCKDQTQINVATIMSAIYAVVMMVVIVGTVINATTESITSPNVVFLVGLTSFFFTSAVLHPEEFFCIVPGALYFLCIPSGYVLLIIYSLCNMNNVSWGTREVPKRKTKEEIEQEKIEEDERKKRKQEKKGLLGWLGLNRILSDVKDFYIQMVGQRAPVQQGPTTEQILLELKNSLDKLPDMINPRRSAHHFDAMSTQAGSTRAGSTHAGSVSTHPQSGWSGTTHPHSGWSRTTHTRDGESTDVAMTIPGLTSHGGTSHGYTTGQESMGNTNTVQYSHIEGTETDFTTATPSHTQFTETGTQSHTNFTTTNTHTQYSTGGESAGTRTPRHESTLQYSTVGSAIDSSRQAGSTMGSMTGTSHHGASSASSHHIPTSLRSQADWSTTSHASTARRQRNNLKNPFWIDIDFLGNGAINFLGKREIAFWRQLIRIYLHPLDEDKQHQDKIAQDLKNLRGNVVFGFSMLNLLWMIIIFQMQLMKEDLEDIFVEIPRADGKPAERFEPLGLVFLTFFAIILILQFVSMLCHRWGTLLHIVAITEIDWPFMRKHWKAEDDIQGAIELSKKLQRIRGLDEDPHPAYGIHSSAPTMTQTATGYTDSHIYSELDSFVHPSNESHLTGDTTEKTSTHMGDTSVTMTKTGRGDQTSTQYDTDTNTQTGTTTNRTTTALTNQSVTGTDTMTRDYSVTGTNMSVGDSTKDLDAHSLTNASATTPMADYSTHGYNTDNADTQSEGTHIFRKKDQGDQQYSRMHPAMKARQRYSYAGDSDSRRSYGSGRAASDIQPSSGSNTGKSYDQHSLSSRASSVSGHRSRSEYSGPGHKLAYGGTLQKAFRQRYELLKRLSEPNIPQAVDSTVVDVEGTEKKKMDIDPKTSQKQKQVYKNIKDKYDEHVKSRKAKQGKLSAREFFGLKPSTKK
uniref:chitin synthase n=1 Tax=Owenia fusiformis TaxID=6347 RepID=A0A023PPY1_OWEFU|nr:chitin synthase [Owenia fusiformis]